MLTPSPLISCPSGPLQGSVTPPGDKSISHRAVMLGGIAEGETAIKGLLEGEDVLNTAKAMQALGAQVQRTGEFAWSVRGVGVAGFARPRRNRRCVPPSRPAPASPWRY